MAESMLLIPGCLYPILLHQNRQYHKAKTGLMPARYSGLILFPCLIQPALKKSYLSLNREVADLSKRIRPQGNQGTRMFIRADMQGSASATGAPIFRRIRELPENDFRRAGVLYACGWTDKVWRTIRGPSGSPLRLGDKATPAVSPSGKPLRVDEARRSTTDPRDS